MTSSSPRRALGRRLRRYRHGADRLLASAGLLLFLAWVVAGSVLHGEQWVAAPIALVMAVYLAWSGVGRWRRTLDLHEEGLVLSGRGRLRFGELARVVVERSRQRPREISSLELLREEGPSLVLAPDDARLDELLPVLRRHALVHDAAAA